MRKIVVALLCAAIATAAAADDRAADREAIRAHIDKIFNAYINSDCATIRNTHSANWIGFTVGAREIVHGIDGYMKFAGACQPGATSRPASHMTRHKILAIDYEFYGDIALVPYIAETSGTNWSGTKLRSIDIYQKQHGEWMQIASNIGLHPDTVEEPKK